MMRLFDWSFFLLLYCSKTTVASFLSGSSRHDVNNAKAPLLFEQTPRLLWRLNQHHPSLVPQEDIVIDVRPESEFVQGHVPGSASLPVDLLFEKMFQLPPPREWPLVLVGTDEQLEQANHLLHPKGWRPVLRRVDDLSRTNQLTETGANSLPTWRPNAFLASVLSSLDEDAMTLLSDSCAIPDMTNTAVDLGCGSGRDTIAMAKRLGRQWTVLGIDEHEGALDRGRALAQSELKEEDATVQFINMDIRKEGIDFLSSYPHPLRLVHGCRFLYKPILEALPNVMEVGGWVIYSHFQDPVDGGPPPAPPFRPSRRLKRGELNSLLGDGFDVLHDYEGELITRGVFVTASFYAAQLRVRQQSPNNDSTK
jgi:SAM-dependent methyltransferase